jgi:hypothetical protein
MPPIARASGPRSCVVRRRCSAERFAPKGLGPPRRAGPNGARCATENVVPLEPAELLRLAAPGLLTEHLAQQPDGLGEVAALAGGQAPLERVA